MQIKCKHNHQNGMNCTHASSFQKYLNKNKSIHNAKQHQHESIDDDGAFHFHII